MYESEKPQIYLFLSVDIIGSTKSKYAPKNKSSWFNNFRNFYRTFPEDLEIKLCCEYKKHNLKYDKEKFVCWKYLGDEVLLYIEITQKNEVPCAIYAFKKTLEERISDNEEQEEKLKLKGTAWIGQTPFVDRKFPYELDSNTNSCCYDFLGPSIDCGFRIGKYSSQTEMAISVEVADLCNRFSELQKSLFYKKSENLKGIFGDTTEYPLFIIKLNGNDSAKEKEFEHLMKPCNENDLDNYIEWHYENLAETYENKVSRIHKDIKNYLKKNESLSKEILAEDKEIKLQNQADVVSEQKKPGKATYKDISSLISKKFQDSSSEN